jgi:hypothetical protein
MFMRTKLQYDKVEMRITQDSSGYVAFAYDITLKGKPVDTLIFSDCSNRRASERMAKILSSNQFENV